MQWSPRDSMVVSLGMSVGERTRRTATLQMILQTQMTAVQAGKDGTLVTDDNIYQTVMDLVRMSGLPSPEQYWTNPQSPQSQQAAQQKQQAAQQQAQITQQVGEKQMNIPIEMEKIKGMATVESARIRSESAAQIESMKAQLDQMKMMVDHITATFDQRLKLIDMNAKYDGEPVPDTVGEAGKEAMQAAIQ
jgi:hypothetical protein